MKEKCDVFPPLYSWRKKLKITFHIHLKGLYLLPGTCIIQESKNSFFLATCLSVAAFLFPLCISFSEVNRSLKWTVMKCLAYRKSFFLTSLVIAWEMATNMTVCISLLLFPLITVGIHITFPNDCSQGWLEQKVFHFVGYRLIASVFHWISPCSCTVRNRR